MMNVVIFFSVLALAATFAIVRGGAPERVVALILVLTAIADFTLQVTVPTEMVTRDIRVFILDVLLAVTITAIALHAERIWPMLVAALLILGAELQVGVWMAPVHHRQIYKIAHAMSAYPILIILFIGTARHLLRTRRGPERDWTVFR